MTATKQSKPTATKAKAKSSAGNLLAVKRQLRRTRPVFKRHGSHRKGELSDRWKKPRGLHNKLKDSKRGCGPSVMDGYRTPAALRGVHVSGLAIVRVARVDELAGLDKATQGIVIAGVGAKRQLEILAAAKAAGIRVLNHKADARMKELESRFVKVKEARAATREAKKAAEAKAAKKDKKSVEESVAADEHESAEEKAKKEVLTSKNQ